MTSLVEVCFIIKSFMALEAGAEVPNNLVKNPMAVFVWGEG